MPNIPAAIRSNNPGAMWGNKLATKWGATKSEVLNDGLGQGNNIAYFPTKFMGACAQMDLWRTSYVNMTLSAADRKWSGGNSSSAYISFLCSKVPGLTPNTVITREFLQSANGWMLMKYQAQWESGQPYPGMTDADWARAQQTVFNSKAPMTVTQKKVAASTSTATVTAASAKAASQAGVHWVIVFAIIIAGIAATVGIWFWIHRKHDAEGVAQPVPNPDRPKTAQEVSIVRIQ